MARLLLRLAVVFITLLATGCVGGTVLGAASAETQVRDLVVTCLSCGEQWLFAPTATLGAGFLSLIRRRKSGDRCPKCGSRAVSFGHGDEDAGEQHGRTA
jgi:Zn finger protein HypA/HybF involved in hydrogenase expression